MKKDKSYGAIIVFENKFLLIKQTIGYWGFPKGHLEDNETAKEATLRELKEETGISKCTILDMSPIVDEYTFIWEDGKSYHKIVEYLIGFVDNDKIKIQENELTDYKWVPFEEALKILTYDNSKEILKKAKEYLDEYERRK